MTKKLNTDKQAVWDKLNYVPPESPGHIDLDLHSMYAAAMIPVFGVKHVEYKEGELATIKVLKSR